jgi:ATP-dependent Clp protease adaptor protein ClpS
MLEAHTKGKAVVTKCHKELAELYQEGLKNEGLISTIEPD